MTTPKVYSSPVRFSIYATNSTILSISQLNCPFEFSYRFFPLSLFLSLSSFPRFQSLFILNIRCVFISPYFVSIRLCCIFWIWFISPRFFSPSFSLFDRLIKLIDPFYLVVFTRFFLLLLHFPFRRLFNL